MAFGGGGGRSRMRSDINVTPLVDVVLVLLIIFLVAMPVVMKKITLDIPKKLEEKLMEQVFTPTQIVVEIRREGLDGAGNVISVTLDGADVPRAELAGKLRDKLETKREKVVFVDFDDATRYAEAVSVMDTVKGAGATTVGLKMKEDTGNPGGNPASPASPGAPGAPAPAQ
jgi:biopolymer transport protein TolR